MKGEGKEPWKAAWDLGYKAGLEAAIKAADNEWVDFEDTQHPSDKAYNEAIECVIDAIKALSRKGLK